MRPYRHDRQGHKHGIHRVVQPEGVLPQPAWKIDPDPVLYDNEMMIDVQTLNLDSASFYQLKEAAQGHEQRIRERIINIVRERGKMHNPQTGSGGMLLGQVAEIGPRFPAENVRPGDLIATLVSLSLTPLILEEIRHINMETGQIHVRGKAILFASGPFAVIPNDLPQPLTLAVLDVCGAPAQVDRLVRDGNTVAVFGAGGKSGLLSLVAARRKAGKTGRIIALEYGAEACREVERLGVADIVLQHDARDAVGCLSKVEAHAGGQGADVTVNCVNIANTEMATILCTKDGGTAYFFSTQTDFTQAVLGAEGVGKDVQLMMGNGYARGHAEFALDLIRETAGVREYFLQKYGSVQVSD